VLSTTTVAFVGAVYEEPAVLAIGELPDPPLAESPLKE
jgi:hypothetical protein